MTQQIIYMGTPLPEDTIDTLAKCLQAFIEIERVGNLPVITDGDSMSPLIESDRLVQIPAAGQGVKPEEIRCGEVCAVFLDNGKAIIKVLESYVRTVISGEPAVLLYLRGVNRSVSQDYVIPVLNRELPSRVYPVLLSPYKRVTYEVLVELSNCEAEETK